MATRTIARGSTVVYEEPLILVEKKQGADVEVRRQYQALTKEQRQHYDSLSPGISSKQGRVEKIFWKHCVQLEREGLRALFSRYWKTHMEEVLHTYNLRTLGSPWSTTPVLAMLWSTSPIQGISSWLWLGGWRRKRRSLSTILTHTFTGGKCGPNYRYNLLTKIKVSEDLTSKVCISGAGETSSG